MSTPTGPSEAASDNTAASVLSFYRHLPFNMTDAVGHMAKTLRESNAAATYPPLLQLAHPGKRVLDVGCGAGWLANTLAVHQRADVTGIDFNPVALNFARGVARALDLQTEFVESDLFKFVPDQKFDLVTSIGVLHHTPDCLGGLFHVFDKLVRPGGFAFIGLYHRLGRAPFLDHFAKLRARGADEEILYRAFMALFNDQALDDTHARSWFRDQVLHPHETQHMLAEVLPVLDAARMSLISTSFNDYRRGEKLETLLAQEQELAEQARQELAAGRYFPGFFCFLAKKLP